jgi:hypothetical protein
MMYLSWESKAARHLGADTRSSNGPPIFHNMNIIILLCTGVLATVVLCCCGYSSGCGSCVCVQQFNLWTAKERQGAARSRKEPKGADNQTTFQVESYVKFALAAKLCQAVPSCAKSCAWVCQELWLGVQCSDSIESCTLILFQTVNLSALQQLMTLLKEI